MIDILTDVSIRQASESDLSALEWGGEYIHFRRLYADIYRTVQLGRGVMWVAEISLAEIVGQAFVSLKGGRHELADGISKAYVYGFRVKPQYRNLGIGTLLMQSIEIDLIERGFYVVTLNVGKENTGARKLYERLGYLVVGAEIGRWSYIDHLGRRQDVHEPAWRMEKELR